jgi:hypothetical protein
VVVAIGTVCLIRNTISRQGGDENSLLTCRSDLELLEIVDKIEIYNLAGGLLPKFDIPEEFFVRRYFGGVRGENIFATSYLRRSK